MTIARYTSRRAPKGASRSSTGERRGKYGIDDPSLVRDIPRTVGRCFRTISGCAGNRRKSACKLVQEWGQWKISSFNVSKIKGQARAGIRRVGRQTAPCQDTDHHLLDVPIRFRERRPHGLRTPISTNSKALFAGGFQGLYERPYEPCAPEEQPEGRPASSLPRDGSGQVRTAKLNGAGRFQGNLFGDPVVDMPAAEVPVAELQAEADAMQFKTAQTRPRLPPRGECLPVARSGRRVGKLTNSVSTPRPRGSTSSTTASSACR